MTTEVFSKGNQSNRIRFKDNDKVLVSSFILDHVKESDPRAFWVIKILGYYNLSEPNLG